MRRPRAKPIFKLPIPWCPKCGANMVLREHKPGQNAFAPFWGCSQYPDCKGTRNIGEDGIPEIDIDEPAVPRRTR